MELAQVEAAIQEIGNAYADRRVNVFEVSVETLEAGALRLRGRVLEEDNRRALVEGLGQRFPGLQVDARAVTVARKSAADVRVVATNLTSLHNGTSFLAEQVTQVLNGVSLEVLWVEKNWGFVRQPDGYLGWTYLPYLSEALAPAPTHLVAEPVALLRAAPEAGARLVTRVLGGTAVCAREVDTATGWAQVELAGGWLGWLPAGNLRALADLPQTAQARREQLVEDAFRMIGVPYLWGGSSAHGIDCSGFAQLLHRWIGINLPRDADMQYAAGKPAQPPFAAGDLLFFGEKGEQRRITHVGISLGESGHPGCTQGGWGMIHSSRRRNGVQVDDVRAVDGLRDSYLCAATYIGR